MPERLEVAQTELHHPNAIPRLGAPIPERHLPNAPSLALRFDDDLEQDVQTGPLERLDVLQDAAPVQPEAAREVAERYREPEAIDGVEQPARGASAEPHLGDGAADVPRSDHDLGLAAVGPDHGDEVRHVGEVGVHREDPLPLSRLDAGAEGLSVAGPLALDELRRGRLGDAMEARIAPADEDLRTRLDAVERSSERREEARQVVPSSPHWDHDGEHGPSVGSAHPLPPSAPAGVGRRGVRSSLPGRAA